ncbi:MAG: response regulator transcription factor [Lachnospiraceae bacterium]|nr:response regulator transcription factor [Lachnospiraceae bacterium]
MNNKFKILVVEDDSNICNIVKTILETNGYQVIDANNASNGKTVFLSHRPDLMILDLGLPDIDGIDFIKNIREQSDTPIIVLSARTNEADKVMALDMGANDYVTKPFGTDELLARVRATLRDNRRNANGEKISKTKFTTRDMVIDYEYRRITIGNNDIKLTQIEYNIVELLSINVGRVLTYSEIIKKIWGYVDSGSIKKLQVNMANIRKKLGETPGENKYISNELGVGYRMNMIKEEVN